MSDHGFLLVERLRVILALSVMAGLCGLTGCTQSLHGSFIASSFPYESGPVRPIGQVEGRSCQDKVLYLFPSGEKTSTDRAMSEAKAKIDGTDFLTDISIDDEFYVGVGYSRRCIVVHATAVQRSQQAARD